jgi:hypothetical protein
VITVPLVTSKSIFSWADVDGAAEKRLKKTKAPLMNTDEHS